MVTICIVGKIGVVTLIVGMLYLSPELLLSVQMNFFAMLENINVCALYTDQQRSALFLSSCMIQLYDTRLCSGCLAVIPVYHCAIVVVELGMVCKEQNYILSSMLEVPI